MHTTTLDLDGSDALHDFLLARYGTAMRIRPTDAGHSFHHRRTDAGAFALENVKVGQSIHLESDPLHRIVITHSSTARVERRCGPFDGRYGPGDVFLTADPDRSSTATWTGAVSNCVLDPGLLARIAAPAPGRRPEPIRFTGLDPRTPAAGAHWWTTHRYVADLLGNLEAGAPLVLDNAAQLLASVALATFPNTALTDPTIEDRRDASSSTLRRAVAYIDDHAAGEVTLADVADAAHVSVRAVQLAFRRHLGTTPMAYLRRVRLDHAHRALVAADVGHTTVAAVAARWGFVNHSRFTAFYRATYGVLPSTTLRGT